MSRSDIFEGGLRSLERIPWWMPEERNRRRDLEARDIFLVNAWSEFSGVEGGNKSKKSNTFF